MTVNSFISYGRQWIDDDDIDAVTRVLQSPYLTQGPMVKEFEKKLALLTGAAYAVAVVNGTAALHLAVSSLELEKGSEGITTPITFAATANSLIYNDLKPVFVDINDDDYTINPALIEAGITDKTRLLLPVHFAGQPAKMEEIGKIARKHNLFVIEDAAHAIGSCYEDGSSVGSCPNSDMTVFSFHPVKTITCGEGGAITTNNRELYEKLLLLRSHGITKQEMTQNPGPWYYEMKSLGYNYRLSDIHAALGCSQLDKLSFFKERRREIVEKYNNFLGDFDWLKTPFERSGVDSCFHLYVLQVDFEKIGMSREVVMNRLKSENIGTQVHYIPLYRQPYYRKNYNFNKYDYPQAEQFYERALSIPLFPKMKDEEVDFVIEKILELGNGR